MKIVVFGAAGRTGRLVVERALGHGHEVTAFVHNTPLAIEDEALTVVNGDVRDFGCGASRRSSDTARSRSRCPRAQAPERTSTKPVSPTVIQAMAECMVSRLAAVSAAGTFARNDKKLSFAYRTLVATAMRPVYDDLEAMEMRIMASDLDWTIVRPVGLTDDPPGGHYRISLDGSLLAKSRAHLAGRCRVGRGEGARDRHVLASRGRGRRLARTRWVAART